MLQIVIDSFHQLTPSSGFGFTAPQMQNLVFLVTHELWQICPLEKHFLVYKNWLQFSERIKLSEMHIL